MSPRFRGGLDPIIAGSNVVHIHGNWSSACHVAARVSHKRAVPYLVAPHGMLEPWALQHRRWRKVLARLLVERTFLRRAACMHALTHYEYRNIRQFGCTRPVAIIPNGVDLTEFDGGLSSIDLSVPRWAPLSDRRVALFLSRIHPKKGLPLLLRAWAALAKHNTDWLLVVAGPDENGHLQQVVRLAGDLGISRQVLFAGPVYGHDKLSLLQQAELFVLPSHSEGFSMAILEALACKLPVLITDHCHFPAVAEFGAGRIAADRPFDFTQALKEMLQAEPATLSQMGSKGRGLVQRDYTWDQVARQIHAVYRWVVSGGTPPGCVVLD